MPPKKQARTFNARDKVAPDVRPAGSGGRHVSAKHPYLAYHEALADAAKAGDPTVVRARRLAAQLTYMAHELESGEADSARSLQIRTTVERAYSAAKGHDLTLSAAAVDLVHAVRRSVDTVLHAPVPDASPEEMQQQAWRLSARLELELLQRIYPEVFLGRHGPRVSEDDLVKAIRAVADSRSRTAWPALAQLCKQIRYTKEPRDLAKEIKRAKARRLGGHLMPSSKR